MEFVRHLLNRVAGKSIRSRIPITVCIEPAVIQRSPLDSELLQFGYRTQHLRWSYVELVSPTAPAYVVRFAGRLGNFPSFFLQHTRPQMQRLVKISGINGHKTSRSRVGLTWLESRVRRNAKRGVYTAIGLHVDGQRERERHCLDVANSLADGCRPEGNHGDAATVTAFYDPSHDVWLGEFARESCDIIFAPLIAGTLKRPHVVRLLHNVRIEPMLLFDDVVDVVVRGSGIRVNHAAQQQIGEIIVRVDK